LALKDFGKEEWPSTKTTKTKAKTASSPSKSVTAENGDSRTKSITSDEGSVVTTDDETTITLDGDMTATTITTDSDDNHGASNELSPTSISIESSEIKQQSVQQTSLSHNEKSSDINEESTASLTVNLHEENGATNGAGNTAVIDDNSENVDNGNQVIDEETVKRTVALLEVTSGEDLAVVSSTNTILTDNSSTIVPLSSSVNDELLVHSAIIKTIEAFLIVLTHKTKAAKPTELALEGIAMIVDHQYFHGRAGGIDDNTGSGRFTVAQAEKDKTTIPPPSLLHRVLFGISEISESYSENVQTAVINTLTKIVTAPTCYVHEGSLLLAMRATFHVYLVTKSTTCKDSARNALLNMLRAVFIRMEAHEAVVVGSTDGIIGSRRRSRQSSPKVENPVEPSDNGYGHNDTSSNSAAAANGNRIRTRTDSSDGGGGILNQSPKSGYSAFPSQYHADAYFLFRSLCKISSKELQADTLDESERKGSILYALSATGTDPTEMNGKILSLELLLAAMDVCGSAFTSGGRFLFLVQLYLSGSLLKNCVSNHTQVAFLSQRIFLVLVSTMYL
jgi:Guanine nucleotide exchange factor in Golgi transport N-terminal/Dimerisation and cyclophilin-binding domain of Mon2